MWGGSEGVKLYGPYKNPEKMRSRTLLLNERGVESRETYPSSNVVTPNISSSGSGTGSRVE